jgi:protein-S-isoprenylcysteine O-methyltransferase Ste14
MPQVALTGLLVWFVIVFGLRSWVHWRRTGRTGYVGVSGAVGSVEWVAGVAFVASVVLGVAAPLDAVVRGRAVPGGHWQHALGLAAFGIGAMATVVAQLAMGDSWRIGVDVRERTALVASGPFRWVRNPIFSAMLLTSVGLVLLVPTPLAVAALLVLVVALELQVRCVEEPYLLRTHGAAYRSYAARVGRFVPGIGRLATGAREDDKESR